MAFIGAAPRPPAGAEVHRLLEADRRRRAWAVVRLSRTAGQRSGQARRPLTSTVWNGEPRLRRILTDPARAPPGATSSAPLHHRWHPTSYGMPALKNLRSASQASAGGIPASHQGHPGGGQSDLDNELDPVDPSGAAHAEGVGDEVPMRAATMPIRMVSQIGMAWRPGRTSRPRRR